MALTFWQESVPGGQVSGRSGYSAPRRFNSVTSPPDYPANCGIGITDFQNCCPATGKVRSIETGIDSPVPCTGLRQATECRLNI